MLITVKVENQWILLPIGWYPEELHTKTELEVSVNVVYLVESIDDDLSKTIDYQLISEKINELRKQEFKLLEYAAQSLMNSIENMMFNGLDIKKIMIEFKKKNIAHSQVSTEFHSILVEKNFENLEP